MITDTDTLTEIRACWNGVEILRGKVQRSLLASVGMLGGTYPFAAADAAHNLPFMHALAVLNDVLEALAKEGVIKCKSHFLRALLAAAENELVWVDYGTISEAVSRRNEVAHRGELVPRGDCWRYVDAVKTELIAWEIVSAS